jgi:nitrite reductase/ring-hydroxylating ferredoxin subunit
MTETRVRGRGMLPVDELVNLDAGLVDRRIFSDPAVYEQELESVFARSWLLLAHDSMIPNAGDYITVAMGEDPVIVIRDQGRRVRAFLNSCRHRGNKICLVPAGNTQTFTCTYHGWSYAADGKLIGVPFYQEAYFGELDREQLGLLEVPRVEAFGGFYFGCWEPNAPALREYLGELAWYLDKFLLLIEAMGGAEIVTTRYVVNGNWKIASENVAGDHYHTPTTHASTFKLGIGGSYTLLEGVQAPGGPFEIALRPGHGVGGVYTGAAPYEYDLAQAERFGPDAVAFVKERYRLLLERLGDTPAKPYLASHGNIFPNVGVNGGRSALRAFGVCVLNPRGPLETDIWQWAVMPAAAPAAVKEAAWSHYSHGGSFPSGFFAQDDAENFERVTESTRSVIARRAPFHYGMGLKKQGAWPGQETWDVQGLPGVVGPRFSEHNQRNFYAYWAHLMRGAEA